MQTKLIGSAEAAKKLNVDRSTLARWVKAGKIAPEVKGKGLRGEMFFNRADVEALATGGRPALADEPAAPKAVSA